MSHYHHGLPGLFSDKDSNLLYLVIPNQLTRMQFSRCLKRVRQQAAALWTLMTPPSQPSFHLVFLQSLSVHFLSGGSGVSAAPRSRPCSQLTPRPPTPHSCPNSKPINHAAKRSNRPAVKWSWWCLGSWYLDLYVSVQMNLVTSLEPVGRFCCCHIYHAVGLVT